MRSLGAIVLLALAAATVWKAVGVHREMHPPRRPVGESRSQLGLPGLEEISFTTTDGVPISAWWSAGRSRAAVVLVHGHGGNREQLVTLAVPLARAGFGVLLLDLRAHGRSGGSACTWGDRERLDVAAAVEWVLAVPGVRSVGVAGFSIGGFAAAGAAARDSRIAAVAILQTQPTLRDELWTDHDQWGWLSGALEEAAFRVAGVRVDEVRPIADLCRDPARPLLLVYGDADRSAPAAGGQQILHACGGPRELLVLAGAEHGRWEESSPGVVPARLALFFERALHPW